jgi:U4/U6.U5 tri-snRNP-associated protein 2
MPPRKKAATKSEIEVEPVKTATNRKRKDKDLEDENIDAANKKSKIESAENLEAAHESHAESKELTDSESKELKDSISDEIKKETVKIEDDEGDEDDYEAYRLRQKTNEKIKCPYLDTINRQVLDFDMEKLCSVTLVNRNIYACLVCGKFFLGRGKGTPAYTHALQNSHFVFMNIISDVEENFGKAFCLPESYEVKKIFHDVSLKKKILFFLSF